MEIEGIQGHVDFLSNWTKRDSLKLNAGKRVFPRLHICMQYRLDGHRMHVLSKNNIYTQCLVHKQLQQLL